MVAELGRSAKIISMATFRYIFIGIFIFCCSCSPAPQNIALTTSDIYIEVKSDGRVFIDSQLYTLAEAEQLLRGKRGVKAKAILISNDKNFPPHANEKIIVDAISDSRLDLVLSVSHTAH